MNVAEPLNEQTLKNAIFQVSGRSLTGDVYKCLKELSPTTCDGHFNLSYICCVPDLELFVSNIPGSLTIHPSDKFTGYIVVITNSLASWRSIVKTKLPDRLKPYIDSILSDLVIKGYL